MTRIKAPAELPELVRAAFRKARSSGDLHFFPTQVALLNVDSIPFQLRFSPALANKPKGPPRDPTTPQKPFDPFENPPAALKVADLGPAHFLVLNKFAVVPEHFILATTPFKHQTHVLEPDDLESTLACIEAYDAVAGGEEATSGGGQSEQGLYAFFNCGDHSGASQPHRHIQLLPIARMRDGLDGQSSAWDVMVDRLDALKPPFSVFSEAIRLGMSGEELHQTYLRLYRRACRAVAIYTGDGGAASAQDAPSQGETLISYNMAMTKNTMAIAPRLAEGARIAGPDGQDLGSVALNGTVLAGTALVKNEVEWEALVKDAKGLHVVLKAIGIPQEGSWKS